MQRGFALQQDAAALKAAHHFQIRSNLADVQLLDCSGGVLDSFEAGDDEIRLQLGVESKLLRVIEREATMSVRVTVQGQRTSVETESSEPPIFQTACRYGLTYELAEGFSPSDEELKAFADGNAVFHAWPYCREFLQNLTMRMGVPVAPLPLLRLIPNVEPPVRKPSPIPVATKRAPRRKSKQ